MFAGMLVYLVAMVGGFLFMAFVPAVLASALWHWRSPSYHPSLIISSTMAIGFLLGGILSWNLIPFHWDMPFWTTLAASVDSAQYGHPLEHKAEGVLVWVLFFSVASAAIVGSASALANKLRNRLRHA